jgi:hypothetical protein
MPSCHSSLLFAPALGPKLVPYKYCSLTIVWQLCSVAEYVPAMSGNRPRSLAPHRGTIRAAAVELDTLYQSGEGVSSPLLLCLAFVFLWESFRGALGAKGCGAAPSPPTPLLLPSSFLLVDLSRPRGKKFPHTRQPAYVRPTVTYSFHDI